MTTPPPPFPPPGDPSQGWGGYPPPQGPPQGQPWGPPPGQQWGPPRAGAPTQSDDVVWAVLTHLSYFVVPFLGPLVAYLVKKDTSPFVRQHAAESLNFHITLAIAYVVSGVLVLVLIGFLMLLAVFVWGVVLAVVAAVAAGRGEPYRYPATIHFLR